MEDLEKKRILEQNRRETIEKYKRLSHKFRLYFSRSPEVKNSAPEYSEEVFKDLSTEDINLLCEKISGMINDMDAGNRILLGQNYKQIHRASAVERYKKQWASLQQIRKDLKISEDSLDESEKFPEFSEEIFVDAGREEIDEVTQKMKRTMENYISEYCVENWLNTFSIAYEGDDIEAHKKVLGQFLKLEPNETYKAVSRSCYFLDKLEKSKEDLSAYQNVLNKITRYCSQVSKPADAVSDLAFLTDSKYYGVIQAVIIGLQANPNTKNPDFVKIAYNEIMASRYRKIFDGGDTGEGKNKTPF